jgi:hypothetical protein
MESKVLSSQHDYKFSSMLKSPSPYSKDGFKVLGVDMNVTIQCTLCK